MAPSRRPVKAQVLVSRMRLGTDGHGIRTLLSFVGCPLDCKYCINPELRKENQSIRWFTPEELFEEVRQDLLYFAFTEGGFTFSGGEPLLHARFIKEFMQVCRENTKMYFNFAMETSLNVPSRYIEEILPEVDYIDFFIDLKDMNAVTYKAYTGQCINKVLRNLAKIRGRLRHGSVFRLPLIPGFNSEEDIARSKVKLEEIIQDLYFEKEIQYDRFEYITDRADIPVKDGRTVCDICRKCRGIAIKELKLPITQPNCTSTDPCPGFCPLCDDELRRIRKVTDDLGEKKFKQLVYGDYYTPRFTPEETEMFVNQMIKERVSVDAEVGHFGFAGYPGMPPVGFDDAFFEE